MADPLDWIWIAVCVPSKMEVDAGCWILRFCIAGTLPGMQDVLWPSGLSNSKKGEFMRVTGFALVLVILLSASSHVHSQMPVMRGGTMLECSGLPCVDLTLANGKRLRMLIDTGDAQPVLDSGVAKELGLEVGPVKDGEGKVIPQYGVATVSRAKVGDGALADLKMLVMDLSEMISKGQMPKADGSLTYTVFKNRVLEMDYPKKMVRFSDPLTSDMACPVAAPGRCEELTTPTFGKKGPPILVATGFSVNGKPITAQIDSLYGGTMLIYPHAVDKLGLSNAAKSEKKRLFPYTDGGVDMLEAGPAQEAFQDRVLSKDATVYFATPKVHVPDGMFDGTVGQELLGKSALVMDLKGMRVWMRG